MNDKIRRYLMKHRANDEVTEFGDSDSLLELGIIDSMAMVGLIAFLEERLPRFAVPRYVSIVDELPKTETHRIQKNLLQKQGVIPNTWDREAEKDE